MDASLAIRAVTHVLLEIIMDVLLALMGIIKSNLQQINFFQAASSVHNCIANSK